jgi:hypothetical protein
MVQNPYIKGISDNQPSCRFLHGFLFHKLVGNYHTLMGLFGLVLYN